MKQHMQRNEFYDISDIFGDDIKNQNKNITNIKILIDGKQSLDLGTDPDNILKISEFLTKDRKLDAGLAKNILQKTQATFDRNDEFLAGTDESKTYKQEKILEITQLKNGEYGVSIRHEMHFVEQPEENGLFSKDKNTHTDLRDFKVQQFKEESHAADLKQPLTIDTQFLLAKDDQRVKKSRIILQGTGDSFEKMQASIEDVISLNQKITEDRKNRKLAEDSKKLEQEAIAEEKFSTSLAKNMNEFISTRRKNQNEIVEEVNKNIKTFKDSFNEKGEKPGFVEKLNEDFAQSVGSFVKKELQEKKPEKNFFQRLVKSIKNLFSKKPAKEKLALKDLDPSLKDKLRKMKEALTKVPKKIVTSPRNDQRTTGKHKQKNSFIR